MHAEDSNGVSDRDHIATDTEGVPLRLVALDGTPGEQRRRAPRRRLVAGCAVERRGPDRRKAKLGLDGLLRTVLADDWKPRVLSAPLKLRRLSAAPEPPAQMIDQRDC